jgi:dTDP-4-amino-4,6-dideoxygalactose transaminase
MASLGDVKPNNWLFTIRHSKCKELVEYLNQHGIQSRRLWVPMNRLPMYSTSEYLTTNNVAQSLYDTCSSLPCSTGIEQIEVERVVDLVVGFLAAVH